MAPKNLQVRCKYCRGTGKREVSGQYRVTYFKLVEFHQRGGEYVVAGQHADWFGCQPTALNNRLAWLAAHGFAKVEAFGREKRYTAVLIEIGEAKMAPTLRTDLQVGDVVIVRRDCGTEEERTVRIAPWKLAHGDWVVGLTGISGGYDLARVVCVVARPKRGT